MRTSAAWQWQDDAACSGEDLELFYGPFGEREAERLAREAVAKGICGGCPVRVDCLRSELERVPTQQWGVWGGLTRDERVALRKRVLTRRRAGGGDVDLEEVFAALDDLDEDLVGEAAPAPEPESVPEPETEEAPVPEPVVVPDPVETGPATAGEKPPPLVDGTGSRRILQAMTAAGHSLTGMADACGLSVTTLSKIRRGAYPEVRLSSAVAIRTMWQTLAEPKPGPDADRSRRKAARSGWVPAAAWAGLDITDPDAVPLDLEAESADRRPTAAAEAA